MKDKTPHYELDVDIAGVKTVEKEPDVLDMICPEIVKVKVDHFQHNNWSSKWCKERLERKAYCTRKCLEIKKIMKKNGEK